MKYYLILLLVFLNTKAQAQTNFYHSFPDSSASWNIHYSLNCFMGNTEEYYTIVISGDTIIQSQTYHKLIIPYVKSQNSGTCDLTTKGYKGAFREDKENRKVYFISPSETTEQLLYDFTLQVGDTVKGVLGSFNNNYPDTIKSIDSVQVGNTYRKRWIINTCYNINLIEGIGSTYGLIIPSPGCATDLGDCSITCFKQNGESLFPETTTNCNIITSSSSFDQNILTIGQVFDFEKGDEFQYKDNVRIFPYAERLKVIDKYYSKDSDTVFYTIFRDNYSAVPDKNDIIPNSEWIYSYLKDTIRISYSNLDSSIYNYITNLQYDTIAKYWPDSYFYDTINENSYLQCEVILNGFICGYNAFESTNFHYTFGKGLGLVHKFIEYGDAGGFPETNTNMIYFKKADKECGNPDTYTMINRNFLNELIEVYPNPAYNILNLKFNDALIGSVVINLFDPNGRLIRIYDNESIEKINVAGLSKGIYILKINFDKGTINKKIVIQ